jgi:hypothetical protein
MGSLPACVLAAEGRILIVRSWFMPNGWVEETMLLAVTVVMLCPGWPTQVRARDPASCRHPHGARPMIALQTVHRLLHNLHDSCFHELGDESVAEDPSLDI